MIFNKRFGRYRLVRKLASGGMAEVFLALKSGPDRFEKLVALKCMHPHLSADERHIEMFYREARLGAQFGHPNLIHVIDAELIQGRHTMAMEFVPGATVDEVSARADGALLPVGWSVFIANEVALGLHDAHELRDLDGTPVDIVHRDISPENVLVGYDGSVKLFDFGVAVAAKSGENEGGLAGKTAYMSPEQCRGRAVDRRSDVFALGVVLHELLTGKRLFKRDNPVQSIRAITEEDPPAPSSINPAVPPDLDEVVLKALARDPAQRYPTARAFHDALAAVQVRHSLFFDAATASEAMRRIFRNEMAELDAVVLKILAAPEQSDATVDLSTFSATRDSAVVEESEVQVDEGSGLDDLSARPEPPASGPLASPLAPHASAAVVDQLRRARRTNIALLVALVLALGGIAAVYTLGGGGEPDEAGVTDDATQVAVSVTSTPPGARIIVDGEARDERTPAQFLLPTGSADVRVEYEGYRPYEESVVLRSGTPTSVRAELSVDPTSPYAPIGRVRVVYTPETAKVFVGEEEVGSASPVLIEALALNREHRIRLEAPGYEALHLPITLDNDEVLDLQVEMSEALELGTFAITSQPSDATVSLNGEEIGSTPLEGLELPANQTYTIQVTRAGYQPWRRAILLRPGAEESVVASLERRGAPTPPRATAPARPAAAPTPPPEPTPEPDEDRYELLE